MSLYYVLHAISFIYIHGLKKLLQKNKRTDLQVIPTHSRINFEFHTKDWFRDRPIKKITAEMGITRLSSIGIGRLSTTAVKTASGMPIHPANKQDVREKMRNEMEPSTFFRLL